MTELLLIRHAVNDFVKTGRLAGWTPGVHLNDEGRAQADALAERLAELPIAAIYTSPLERAIETAEPLARVRGLPLRIVDAVGEVKYGEWTGGELKELSKHELWHGVQYFPSITRFPAGETIAEMQARAVGQCEAIHVSHPDDIVAVVSHADVIKAIVAYYVGVHLDLFQRLFIAPASMTWLHLGKGGPRLIVLNDTGSIPKPPERQAQDTATVGGVEPVVAENGADGKESPAPAQEPSGDSSGATELPPGEGKE
ncbi:MAG: MSMEG_4193 family putative phosphomutase [Anaerolineae bacterium]